MEGGGIVDYNYVAKKKGEKIKKLSSYPSPFPHSITHPSFFFFFCIFSYNFVFPY